MRRAGISGVGAGENRDARLFQRAHGLDRAGIGGGRSAGAARKCLCEHRHIGAREVRREARVLREIGTGVQTSDAFKNAHCRHDERAMARDERREVGIGRFVDEQVCETVGAGIDCVSRAGRPDVDDGKLVSCMCGRDHGAHRPLVSVGSDIPYVCPSSYTILRNRSSAMRA